VNLTHGTLLDGRVRYAQPEAGYRTGLEPVLLAAAVPAAAGDRVLEAGTGAGAGLLCLAARVPGLTGLALERDPEMARLAEANFAANGEAGVQALAVDLLQWAPVGVFDHAFANPPWHDPAGTASPLAERRAAKQAEKGLLREWVARLAAGLRPRGTLSLILPAASLLDATAALAAAKCEEVTVFPLWPHAGKPAKLLIIQGIRLGRGPCRVLPGLILHDDSGLTAAADAILCDGKQLLVSERQRPH
jgi:tRNA1Val (adenine37-N6)-methyltransferase